MNDKLLRLADFLETIPPERFDMNHWHTMEDPDEFDVPSVRDPECDTAACAFGWATALWPEELCITGIAVALREDPDVIDYSAAAEFFGIPRHDAHYLFDPTDYSWEDDPEPQFEDDDFGEYNVPLWRVIDRIREFARNSENRETD